MRDDACQAFLQWALPKLGFSWPGFRKPRRQVCRKIARRLTELGLSDLDQYRKKLEAEEVGTGEWAELDSLCRVTISRFFRDRAVWDTLGQLVIPELAANALDSNRSVLRAWSAGCASGEEPYSLAILWHLEIGPRFPELELEILATDADEHLLHRAHRATYPAGCLREISIDLRDRAFRRVNTEGKIAEAPKDYRLLPNLRSKVKFRQGDLRHSTPRGPFDLVFCRNLAWTYFDPSLQTTTLDRITSVLRPGGFLATGGHEELPSGGRGAAELRLVARSLFRRPQRSQA